MVTNNYQITELEGTLEVTKATDRPDGNKVSVDSVNTEYDGNSHTLDINGLIEGEDEVWYSVNGGEFTKTPPTVTNVGDSLENITVKVENSKYDDVIIENLSITVTKKLATLVPNNYSDITYGDDVPADFSYTVNGLVEGEVFEIITENTEDITLSTSYNTLNDDSRKAGEYTIKVDEESILGLVAENYSFTADNTTLGVMKVEKAALEVSALAVEVEFGEDVKEIDYTATGFKFSDDLQWLKGEILDVFEAVDVSNSADVNSYDITAKLDALSEIENYTITYVGITAGAEGGAYEVVENTNAQLTVKAYSGIYDANSHDAITELTPSFKNSKGEDIIVEDIVYTYSIDGGKTFTEDMPTIRNVVDSTAIIVKMQAKNFEDVIVSLTQKELDANEDLLTPVLENLRAEVIPADLSISVGAYTKGDGASDPEFTASIIGLKGDDVLSYSIKRNEGETAGITYPVVINYTEDSNYNIVKTDGTLYIVPNVITLPIIPETTPPTTPEEETVAPVAPQATQAPQTDIEDAENPQTNIGDSQVPFAQNASWALVNLLLTILTAFISFVLLLKVLRKNKEENENEEEEDTIVKHKRLLKILGIVPMILSIILFIRTQDMSLPMIMIDQYTLLTAVLALVEVLIAFFSRKKEEDKNETNA